MSCIRQWHQVRLCCVNRDFLSSVLILPHFSILLNVLLSFAWNKVNRNLLVFFLGTIHHFIWFPHASIIYIFHKVICAGITACSTGVADVAGAREKPPIIISLQTVCSQGHRPIRQAWLKATGAWAYRSGPFSKPSQSSSHPPSSLIPLAQLPSEPFFPRQTIPSYHLPGMDFFIFP